MNATVKIFALALASNFQPQQQLASAFAKIAQWGDVEFSPIYEIPCRDGVGADYWNCACLLRSTINAEQLIEQLKQLEQEAGRIRPSHQISLDVDLIAWGENLQDMQFNPKKLPLALDVKIPLYELWPHPDFLTFSQHFPVIQVEAIF